jgi:hypothetical protein
MANLNMKSKLIIFLIISFISISLNSNTMAGFIDTGQGARPIGLGRAYTAVANDVHSIFYNPAGMININKLAISTMYARLYPGVAGEKLHYEMVAAVIPLSFIGNVGVALTNFNIDIYNENAIYLSYGRQLPFNLAIGGNFKFLRWAAEGDVDPITGIRDKDFSNNSFSFDVGLMYQIPVPLIKKLAPSGRLQFGLMLSDINQPNISENGSDNGKLPLALAFGVGFLSDNVLVAADLSRRDEFTKLHIGTEYLLHQVTMGSWNFAFHVRGGGIRVLNGRKGGELDLGFGLLVRNVLIDYVYVYPLALRDVNGSHKVSLSFQF